MVLYPKDPTLWYEPIVIGLPPASTGRCYWLAETYSKTNYKVVEDLLQNLILFYPDKNKYQKEFFEKEFKYKIGFYQVPESYSINCCFFDPNLKMTIIPIKESKIIELCSDPNTYKNYLAFLRQKIVHEDTHKQQFDRYEGYSKDYKFPNNEAFSLKTQADVDYFSQTIEADAYGREAGQTLKDAFPDTYSEILFKMLMTDKTDCIKEYTDVYKDPRISRKAFQHFWRALYDYLKENEKPLEENSVLSDLNYLREYCEKRLKEKV